MINILVNAYACSPGMGSEPGMAWNWCISLAKYCNLFIITEGEFREKIEKELTKLPQGNNMHFFYNPVSQRVRNMCWNQGNWLFYRYYKKWQRKTFEIARQIIQNNKIDVIHQLNMIGFREPGYLWEIDSIPFVWGPVGGLKQFPESFLKGAEIKYKVFYRLKNMLNLYQLKHNNRVDKAFNAAKVIISSIPDSKDSIRRYKNLDSIIIPETGCQQNDKEDIFISNTPRSLIWIGKFDYRKRLDVAIESIARLSSNNVMLYVCGTGSEKQQRYYKELAIQMGVEENIKWMGNLPHNETLNLLRKCDALFFTSVNDDTSTVVMEAIENLVPVICHDAFGFGFAVNDLVGYKIPLIDKETSVKLFAETIDFLYNHNDSLKEKSLNCRNRRKELSWDNKAKQLVQLYKSVLLSN